MSLRDIQFKAGIDREGTEYSAEGGWYDCDKVRFRKGFPEKIGGWVERSGSTVFGVCRNLHNWSSHSNRDYLAIGTSSKVYVEHSGAIYDITPSYDYKTSSLAAGLAAGATSIAIKTGDGDSFLQNLDVARIQTPPVLHNEGAIGGSSDPGGPYEYVKVAGISSDTLTISRDYLDSGDRNHSYNSSRFKGANIERIPQLSCTVGTTSANVGGVIGLVHGSPTVVLRQDDSKGAGHGCVEGDYITFLIIDTAISDGTVTEADLLTKTGFRVTRVLDDTTFEIEIDDSGAVTANSNLAVNLAAGATSCTVVSGDVFGSGDIASSYVFAKIEQEYVRITNVNTSTEVLTIARGQFGSEDVPHSIVGTTVTVKKVDWVGGTADSYILHDINVMDADTVPTVGFGSSTWGFSIWGISSNSDVLGTPSDVSMWSIDNYGQDLVLCRRDGAPYYWPLKTSTDSSGIPNYSGSGTRITADVMKSQPVLLSTVGSSQDPSYDVVATSSAVSRCPAKVRQLLVYPTNRIIVALGCTDFDDEFDPMMVRWSSDNKPGSWWPFYYGDAIAGKSGYFSLSSGSEIISAQRSKTEVLVWTDLSVYYMRWNGSTFQFAELASNISIIGPLASVSAVDSIYWMSERNFYSYNGAIKVIPCTVLQHVFDDLNYKRRFKIFAASNTEFNEVSFFYPSGSSEEIDRYVTYNYADEAWTIGTMDRTAWSDSSLRQKPQSAAIVDSSANTSKIYEHEVGEDDVGEAMTAYIESAYFDIDEGDRFSFISRMLPDVKFISGNEMKVKIKKKDYPNSGTDTSSIATDGTIITGGTERVDLRIRGRQASVRFESDKKNVGWRLGRNRLDITADGGR